jgi:hypothetical protein
MTGTNDRRPGRIELEIESLELSGFPASQRFAIADAVEHALADLLGTQGWPSTGESDRREAHTSMALDGQADHHRVGRAIAEAIFVAAAPATLARRSP